MNQQDVMMKKILTLFTAVLLCAPLYAVSETPEEISEQQGDQSSCVEQRLPDCIQKCEDSGEMSDCKTTCEDVIRNQCRYAGE